MRFVNKFLIFLSLICIMGCFSFCRKSTVKHYHLVYMDIISNNRDYLFDKKSLRYVGRLDVDEKNGNIKGLFLRDFDEQWVLKYLNRAKIDRRLGIVYNSYSEDKPKKFRKEDIVKYIKEDSEWYFSGDAKYGDKDFWIAFEKGGIITPTSEKSGIYRLVDNKKGEEFLENKQEALGDETLMNSVLLNKYERFR